MRSNYTWSIWIFLLTYFPSAGQDTLRLTLQEVQKIFADSNLQVLIQRSNVEAARAQVLQAKLFANPTFSLEQSLIGRSTIANNEPLGPYAQQVIQVQQLFLLAGKRNKNIQLAQLNTQLNEYQLFDLLRTLVFSLNSNFFEVAYQLRTLEVYRQEAKTIEQLVYAYRELQKDGNVAMKEVVRLESSLFSLQSDMTQLELDIAQNQADLRVLLSINRHIFIVPELNESKLDSLQFQGRSLDQLIETAEENRYDIKIQEANVRLATTNLKLQRSYRVPDVLLGYTYDRAGSYVNNYHGVTLQSTLPLFNRNQGNIKTADYQLQGSKRSLGQARVALHNDVILAYTQALKTETLYRHFDKQFVTSFTTLIRGVMEGYEKKTISLVEFMDFFDSYKENVVQFNALRNNRIQSYLKLNFSVATSLFEF